MDYTGVQFSSVLIKPLTHGMAFYNEHEKYKFFFKIDVYITYDKENVMATCVPNPISFYYTSNESLLNNLYCRLKYVLMYTRTHLTRSDEPCVLHCGGIKAV